MNFVGRYLERIYWEDGIWMIFEGFVKVFREDIVGKEEV